MKESFVPLYKKGQFLLVNCFDFWELKECGLKNYALVWKSLIDFNEAFAPYSELQFLEWPSTVVHSPPGLMYIAYGLVILVHRNIQVTTITIGYIQLRQGFECQHVEEELT